MKLVKENERFAVYRTEPKDWEKIKDSIMRIENSAFEPGVRQSEYDIWTTFADKRDICLIVVDKKTGEIVAYSMGAPLEDYSFLKDDTHYGENDTIYIESTAVLPEYQNQGIGKLLKEAFIEQAKTELLNRPGVIGVASKLIKFDTKFLPAIEFVFGNTLIVDNSDTTFNFSKSIIFLLSTDLESLANFFSNSFS